MKPSLLDAAIEEHKIPKWPYEASFDRIIVYMIPEEKAARDTYTQGGLIYKPENKHEAEKAESPRGIIVSAGLQAQDIMRSHGMGLGHMVWVARYSPWRHEVEKDEQGRDIQFFFMRVGDIVGSETLQQQIRAGKVTVEIQSDGTHRYKFHDEEARPRFEPPSYAA